MRSNSSGEGRLSVTYFYREPRPTGVSIEGIFKLVTSCLKDRVKISEFFCDGGVSRQENIRQARKHATAINHITGDVNFLAIGLRGKRTILTIHDLGFYENPVHPWYKKLVYWFFWFYLPLRYVSIITVVSQFTKQKVIQHFGFPESKIRVIADPVKPLFSYHQKVAVGCNVILMMGTGKHKNLSTLIEAVRGTNYHIDIVGWPAADELAKLKEYDISHTVYNRLTDEQVLERYIACDVLFNASFYEGFGMPIIEAQSVGRPVITSNFGAMKEVGEGSAVLVDPTNVAEIKAAIQSLSDDVVYQDFVSRGRENVARYDYLQIADQYLRVYEELAQ